MAHRNRAAIHIYFVMIDAKGLFKAQNHAGKGFVDGFGLDARFRAPVALFNNFNSDDGR